MKQAFTLFFLLFQTITFAQQSDSVYFEQQIDIVVSPEQENEKPAPILRKTNIHEASEYPMMYFERPPEFPGGQKALLKFIEENLKYPPLNKCRTGAVILSFSVLENGSLEEIKVVRSTDNSLNQYAVDLIKGMPNWIPAQANSKNVKGFYTLRVRFR